MNNSLNLRVILILLFCFPLLASAQTGTDLLNSFMKSAKTLEATFTQEVLTEKGVITQTSYGQFYLSRPGKFRWSYESPTPQEIISDGKKLWVYDKDLAQVTVKPLKAALGSSPAAILTQKDGLNDDFIVLEKSAREGLQWVDLRPKKKDVEFTKILVGLDQDGVQAMDLYDNFGQITMIRFQEAAYNVEVSPSSFEFTPPKDVDVIGE